MKKLIDYMNGLSAEERTDLAEQAGTTVGYIKKAHHAGQLLNPKTCVAIEQSTAGAVTRQELRPDWQEIWPEIGADNGR